MLGLSYALDGWGTGSRCFLPTRRSLAAGLLVRLLPADKCEAGVRHLPECAARLDWLFGTGIEQTRGLASNSCLLSTECMMPEELLHVLWCWLPHV